AVYLLTATTPTVIYTLSLHDALPICPIGSINWMEYREGRSQMHAQPFVSVVTPVYNGGRFLVECIESVLAQSHGNLEYVVLDNRSEEHTSELQSRENLVCRLLLEKKK